jgi:hypothetical protein
MRLRLHRSVGEKQMLWSNEKKQLGSNIVAPIRARKSGSGSKEES